MESKYALYGASSEKEDVHNALNELCLSENEMFCKIIPDHENPEYCNIMHSDGAGTKALLAYMYWKETKDMNVWKNIAHDAIIMNIDDLLCVGAVDHICLSSVINRNKNLIPGCIIKSLILGTEQVIQELKDYGITIYSCGGETADVGDIVKSLIVDSTVFCRMKCSDIISNHNIRDGDVILGLSSFGEALYEDCYNSGIGSNGLTLARHTLLTDGKSVETFDVNLSSNIVYSGPFHLTDRIEVTKDVFMELGKLMLSPTKTYAPIMKVIFEKYRKDIHGMIHCTGGGQTKVLRFLNKLQVIKDNLFEVPMIFRLIQKHGNVSWREMYQVFNMGHRMELYVSRNIAQDLIEIIEDFHVEAKIVGYVKSHEKSGVIIKSEFGDFFYE
jgi:phosphoribosylformylglycinamidine cyclo-ligase